MTTPRFSVIVPVYNASATIAATVCSVLAQTERDFELLLVDDGSTDDSLARMLRLGSTDKRIRVLTHRNEGVSATRNLGVKFSKGKLIAFLDADDLWKPRKLEQHAALHDADPSVGISYARIAFLEADEPVRSPVRTESTVPAGPLSIAQVIGENPVCTASNIVVSRACFDRAGGFRTGMSFAEDQEWLARAIDRGIVVQGIDQLLVDYRMSPGGLSSDLRQMYRGWRQLARTYAAQIELDSAEAIYCRYLARRALRCGGYATTSLRFALRGLRLDAAAFLSDARRGGLTLAGAVASLFMPRVLRVRVFA